MRYIILLLTMCMLVSCRTTKTVEIPVEIPVIHNNYIHNTDTIIQQDSVYRYVYCKNDTVHDVQYKYKYIKDIKRDSVLVNDTIYQPKYITKTVEVHKLYWWQTMLCWVGAVLIGIFGLKFALFVQNRLAKLLY